MGRFDVYQSPDPAGPGYVLDVQTDLLDDLNTRVVVPLLPLDLAPKPFSGLNPTVAIAGQPHLMLTQFISAVPAKALRNPIASLEARSDDVLRALDTLLTGF